MSLLGISRLKLRLGEFWWASLLMFLASRATDVVNAFIGLWLVPKYVGQAELGAVLPLTQFAGLIAIPISIFAMAFMKQVNVLAEERSYGQMKTMLRSVFAAAVVFLVLSVVVAHLLMPLVLERVRVAKGSLGILIVAASFAGAIAPIYTNALQGLKRFRVLSLVNFIGAPLRLVVMLATMPFRALAGYFMGQFAVPCFQIGASMLSLRRELGGRIAAEPYWTRSNVRRFAVYAFFVALYMLLPTFTGCYEALLIRQRLSPVDSAAYYMISRFAEIGTYVGATLSVVIFPFAAERRRDSHASNRLAFWSMAVTLGFGAAFAVLLYFIGPMLLKFLPDGATYVPYAFEMAVLTIILTLGITVNCGLLADIAAEDFRFLWWWVPFHVLYGAVLLFVTGYGYFIACLPLSVVAVLDALRAHGLAFYLSLMGGAQLVKLACQAVQKVRCRR